MLYRIQICNIRYASYNTPSTKSNVYNLLNHEIKWKQKKIRSLPDHLSASEAFRSQHPWFEAAAEQKQFFFFLLFIERLTPNTEQLMINITTIPLKIICRCFPPSLHSFSVGLLAEILNHQYPSARFIHLKWTAKWLLNK